MQAPGGEGVADRASVAVAGATQECAARVERCARWLSAFPVRS